MLEQTASFLGVPAPASPDIAADRSKDDAPPIPTAADLTRSPSSMASPRNLGNFDPARIAQDHALAWGRNQLNASSEALVSYLTDNARARFNFHFDRHGKLRGEGDVFLPLYDSPRTLVFTQIGARSMDVDVPQGEANGKDRLIGNFGLGQRFFPNATEEDSGNWMFGYNFFLDHDFTRSHNRGGVGVEWGYDWLRLASNAYFPLSDWKASHDFDRRFKETHLGQSMEERPARGWDVHVEAALPFYPGLAFTGGLTQWVGDKVDTPGHGPLKDDPRIWDVGVKYTPFPLFTAFVTQRHTESGRQDTVAGFSVTYHFGMSWRQQIDPAQVWKLTTVSGARNDFVKRENFMPLARRVNRESREMVDLCTIATGGMVTYVPGKTPGTYDEVHTFHADAVSSGSQAEYALIFNGATRPATVEVLVVAGGGGGGRSGPNGHTSGGGGAGRFIYVPSYPITADAITVKVGTGGDKPTTTGSGNYSATRGDNGGNSEFGGIAAPGGGGGASHSDGAAGAGQAGGSGGGATFNSSGGSATPGTVVPAVSGILDWGHDGGSLSGQIYAGSGGGGAGGAGSIRVGSTPNGGAGVESAISGQTVTYARGGDASNAAGINGAAGTGNGGSGGTGTGGKGGSGIVIVRFPSPSHCTLPSS